MLLITLPIAILLGILVGRKVEAKSKTRKILVAILIPLIVGFIANSIAASAKSSEFGFWFDYGQCFAFVAIPGLVLFITLLICLKVKKETTKGDVQNNSTTKKLRYKYGEETVEVEVELTEEEIAKMKDLQEQDPMRWENNDYELVKEAKRLLGKKQNIEDAKGIEGFADSFEIANSHPKKKRENNKFNQFHKVLLILILSFGLLFGLFVLGSYKYVNQIYPSKAMADDERLLDSLRKYPAFGEIISEVFAERCNNEHNSDYVDFISGKRGECSFDHCKAKEEAIELYCRYSIDMAKNGLLSEADGIARNMFEKSRNGFQLLYINAGVEILEYAANMGNMDAQFDLGCFYGGCDFHGNYRWTGCLEIDGYKDLLRIDGVGIDDHSAAYWYYQSAKQGNYSAMVNLGLAYLAGDGVPVNVQEGLDWILKAANSGDSYSLSLLAYIYNNGFWSNGKYLISPDVKKGQYWWERAANNGD